jgi:hypothetical protein
MFTQLLIVTAKKIMKALSDFRQIVEEYPNSIAVVDAGVSLSFSEFDTVSDALACRLHEGRRENSNIVGYLGWVSATCIVANMAVLKAGQCIVALDAENPPAGSFESLSRMPICPVWSLRLVMKPWLHKFLTARLYKLISSSVIAQLSLCSPR